MKTLSPAAALGSLREENPEKFVSLVRLSWPEIRAALDRGHSIKVVHARFVKAGIRISYRLFTMYVGQLRREDTNKREPLAGESRFNSPALDSDIANKIALVQAPKRRLLSAKAAAHYLGIDQRTLKRITDGGRLVSRALGPRRVYLLEELDSYIDSLPKVGLKAS